MPGVSVQVLIVDDDEFSLSVLDDTLVRMGYTVAQARDGQQALDILRHGEIRLVVTDWDMPNMNGVDLCRALRREDLSGYVYIIMLTGREGAKQRMEGLCAGADDFLTKPLDPEELLVCLKSAERILSLETRDLALFALAKLAESRDTDTSSHIERVQSYSRLIAQNLSNEVKSCYGVDDDYIRLLYQTSPLHDLGKVGIPDAILLKPGKLTPDEFAIMKTHTIVGAKTLDAALQRFPNARFLRMAREIAASHHEKFDGSGYPQGLAGEQIPLCGRIVAIADVYDALTSRRIYKEAMSHEQARAIILNDRGSHFDPEAVDAYIRAEPQILSVRDRLRDAPEDSKTPVPIPAPPPPNTQGPFPSKILVVEDDPVLLAKLKELLAATGQPVFTAADGQEAIPILLEHSPRVVISDWVMPKMDGVDLCRTIRQRLGADQVHFIMLTAHSDRNRLLDAYEAGVDDFISKPFHQEEFLARVRAGIRASKLRDDLLRKATGSQALNAQLATLNSQLERLSNTDELTGLFNRRAAMSRLSEQWEMVTRFGRPLSIAMIDIDHFKQINDAYGHDTGDIILRRVAEILREQARGIDVVCRVGGEEFLMIFPTQTLEEANVCAERCRQHTAANTFNVRGQAIPATISIGLATRVRGMDRYADLLKAADLALYAAKRAGRNRVCVAEQSDSHQAAAEPASLPISEIQIIEPANPAEAPINMDATLKRCDGDQKFARAVLDRFRKQVYGELAKIDQALTARNADVLGRSAHSLKSMAAYIAADTVAEVAKQIETLVGAGRYAEIGMLMARLRIEVDRIVSWIDQNPSLAGIIRNSH